MKTVETYTIRYVVPETPEEQAELDRVIAEVRAQKFGVDFGPADLKLIKQTGRTDGRLTRD